MATMHFFTLLLLFPLLVSATPPPFLPPPPPLTPTGRSRETQGEIDALTAFRLALRDPLGALDGWDEASLSAPCDWRGVACEPNAARVVELRLPRLHLSGLISPRLADLRLLQRLSLRSNQFYGSIPPALASLGNLRSLFLQSNALSGPIRTFPLSNLSSLQVLSFVGNLLISSVPAAFPPGIHYLDLSSNAFAGLVPANLSSAATQLQFLDLSYNHLRGIIPGDLALSFLYRGNKAFLFGAYFLCAHRALHGCPAKKQVQRSGDDPLAYDVTYHEDHTCLQQPREELEQGDVMQRDQEQSAAAQKFEGEEFVGQSEPFSWPVEGQQFFSALPYRFGCFDEACSEQFAFDAVRRRLGDRPLGRVHELMQ
ncbi:probable inactive leucine-rich repeat receptor kinase XIAO [Zingiber officinale]|uniref:probable inactive leucine-rich repeat receptor kinase XIAO n=1 Tax=Zingiber officinale TaxID=94328 RepID=UPI001C4B2FA3|nr:probable inactive leucine-rich repeat receptor kinase XIAO [Zingiber officinale]